MWYVDKVSQTVHAWHIDEEKYSWGKPTGKNLPEVCLGLEEYLGSTNIC